MLSSSPFSCQCQEEIPLQKVYRYSKPWKLDHLSFKITKLAFACSRGNNILIMINRLRILSKGRHFSFTSSKWASNLGWVSRAMQLWQRTPIRLWKENYHFAKTEVDVNKPPLTDFMTIRYQFKRSGPTLQVTDFNLVILLIPSLQALYKTINVLIVTWSSINTSGRVNLHSWKKWASSSRKAVTSSASAKTSEDWDRLTEFRAWEIRVSEYKWHQLRTL